MRSARRSFKEPHPCQFDWPEDCFVQCGGNGIVFTGKPSLEDVLTNPEQAVEVASGVILDTPITPSHYRTAFFEAFPRNPDTFIRREGATIEEAEEKAWDAFQKQLACPSHEYEKRGYRNGLGFCKHCDFSKSGAFEPEEECYLCGSKTYYGQTNQSTWYCEACSDNVPDELLPAWKLEFRKWQLEDQEEGI